MGADEKVPCVILGGGGHARVLIDSLHFSGAAILRGILDSNQSLWGKDLMGVPILGGDDLLPKLAKEGVTRFVVGVGGVGDSRIRRELFELGMAQSLTPLTAVCHPSAVCSPWARLGAGSVVFPAAVVNAGAILGMNVIVNTGAIVEHDCIIGDHVHIATGARLSGGVRVGNGAHVGAGATVRQGIIIGDGAIVGVGSVVIADVPPHMVVVGVPARPILSSE
ncbi:acetyltransferase [Candidatus Uhrbacteria bacterium]|nr:acetyltransferase [Candidatus Uhrbacteria bacterium]